MQQVPTSANVVVVHASGRNMVSPTMSHVVGQQCCVRLHGLYFLLVLQHGVRKSYFVAKDSLLVSDVNIKVCPQHIVLKQKFDSVPTASQ